jgi:hypothetical protein
VLGRWNIRRAGKGGEEWDEEGRRGEEKEDKERWRSEKENIRSPSLNRKRL